MSQSKAVLKVSERDTTINPRRLRMAGYVPVVLYGKDQPSVLLQVQAHAFTQQLAAGQREFNLEGFTTGKVHLKQLQKDPVYQTLLSAEFVKA